MWRVGITYGAIEHHPEAQPSGAKSVSYRPHPAHDATKVEKRETMEHRWCETEAEAIAFAVDRQRMLLRNAAYRLGVALKLTDNEALRNARRAALTDAERAALQALITLQAEVDEENARARAARQ